MEKEYLGTLKGHFLLAMPSLQDPNFHQTVTCMCEHNSEGAMGLVVNRVHYALTAKDIFEELKIDYKAEVQSTPIHIGGPVHMTELFVLHGPPFDWEACIKITHWARDRPRLLLRSAARGGGRDNWKPKLNKMRG